MSIDGSGKVAFRTDDLRRSLRDHRLASLVFEPIGHLELLVEWRLVRYCAHLPADLLLSAHPTNSYDARLILHVRLAIRWLRVELVVQVVVKLGIQRLLDVALRPHLRLDLILRQGQLLLQLVLPQFAAAVSEVGRGSRSAFATWVVLLRVGFLV